MVITDMLTSDSRPSSHGSRSILPLSAAMSNDVSINSPTGLAPAGFYGRRTAPWDFPRAPVTPKARQQPSAIKIRIKRLGHLHTSALLRAVKRGVINSFDASQLIGLQPAYFKKVEHELSGSVRKSGSRPTQKC